MKLRKPVADDAAVKKCDDAIGVLRHIVVMCDEHDGLVEIACERANHIHHFGFGFGIEIAAADRQTSGSDNGSFVCEGRPA